MSEQLRRNALTIQVAALTVLGALVRFLALGRHELWLDEAFRILWAIEPNTSLWEQATVGHAGSVFTTWLSGFVWPRGHSFFFMRALQALCSTTCIPLFYLLARRYLGGRALLGALALLTLSPMHVAIARQAEEYAFLVLFALLATLLVTQVIETRRVETKTLLAFGAVSLSGFLSGGYMLLPWFAALAISLVWLLRGELKARDWALLTASQLPMVAVFLYSLSFWAIDPRPEIPAYLAFMRDWVQLGSPTRPTNVLADLFFYGQLWSWGPHVGRWVVASEFALALCLLYFLWRGHRSLREKGAPGVLPALSVLVFVLVNGAIFLKYSGLPFYFSRVYSPATFFLFILLAEGLRTSLREVAWGFSLLFATLVLLSTTALKLEVHPARPILFRNLIAEVAARSVKNPVYVHPGELADVIRLETRDSGLEFVGVWRDSFATPEATISLDERMSDEALRAWAGRVAQSGSCLLLIDYFVEGHDPDGVLRGALEKDYGYTLSKGTWAIPLYCPGETKEGG